MRALLFAAPLALLTAACGSSADPEAVLETVRMTEQSQLEAIGNKDLAGTVRNYRDDAVLVVSGAAPAKGLDAIRGSFEGMLKDPNFAAELTPGPGWAAESGELAVTTALVKLTATDEESGKPVTRSYANETVWYRADGAPWQIAADTNTALAASAPAGEAAPR